MFRGEREDDFVRRCGAVVARVDEDAGEGDAVDADIEELGCEIEISANTEGEVDGGRGWWECGEGEFAR